MSPLKIDYKTLSLQYAGGNCNRTWVRAFLRDFPALRVRWSIDALEWMVSKLDEVGTACQGGVSTPGLRLLAEYLEFRGDDGGLDHVTGYGTSEYGVLLFLLREAESKERGR